MATTRPTSKRTAPAKAPAKRRRPPPPGGGKLDSAQVREKLLDRVRAGSSLTSAAESIGVTRRAVNLLRERDPAFAAAYDEAESCGVDRLEDEAYRRAVQGDEREIYGRGGKLLGRQRVYSDKLLELLLKARRPEKYRDRQPEGGPQAGRVVFRSYYGGKPKPAAPAAPAPGAAAAPSAPKPLPILKEPSR